MALPRLGLVAASHAEQEGLFSLINCKWLIINLTRRSFTTDAPGATSANLRPSRRRGSSCQLVFPPLFSYTRPSPLVISSLGRRYHISPHLPTSRLHLAVVSSLGRRYHISPYLPTSRLHLAVVSSLGRRYPSQSYACLAGSSAQIRRESEDKHILAAGWAISHLWFSADSTMADAACHLMKIAEEELVRIRGLGGLPNSPVSYRMDDCRGREVRWRDEVR